MVLVKNRMSAPVVTISPESPVRAALELMRRHDIRHLPVVKAGRLVGLVTERTILPLVWPAMLEEISVAEAMIADPLTIGPEERLEAAARIFYQRKVGCLPVVENGKLVGILTVPDLLATFVEFLGLLTASVRLDVVLADRDDSLEEVAGLVRRGGGQILSVGLIPDPEGRNIYSIRLTRQETRPLVKQIEALGHRVVSVIA